MTKCGKGCMPECEYFTTGGCISPFNCPYKIETGYINSVTSIPTYMEQYNGMSDDNIKCLKPENAELCHRADVAEKALRRKRESGKLPVVVIDKDISNRMASTIRHNRARGSHSIELMTNIVAELVEAGMSDAWIMKNIGMDAEELLRLKQISGLAALFKDKDFTNAWEV